MKFKDYYKILGLESSKVTEHEIKVAYREAAKKYHPDLNVGDRIAEEKIKDINEAYKILSNSATKKKYDRMWNSNIGRKRKKEENNKNKIDIKFSDFWNMFFGTIEKTKRTKNDINKNPVKGENIETKINLSIEETFYGCEKKISLRTTNGKMKTFNIKVPAGIRNNEKIRLIGQGKKGINGGKSGDLLIGVNIENSNIFKLQGIDLYTDLKITPWEAALGTKATLNTIDDSTSIYIPQGIESGEKVRIQGKGYKDGKGGRGDLVAEVKIVVPKTMSEEEKKLYTKLSEISTYNPRGI
mgnify:FL=1